MNNELTFKNISLRGRVAFAINCLEKYLSRLDLNLDDWNIVLHKYWSFTDIEYLDDWNEIISEILPDNLLEFDNYQEHGFDNLNEDEFKKLYILYRHIDDSVMELMRLIFELGSSHAYSVIINEGNASLRIVQDILTCMNSHNIGLPSIGIYQSMLIQDNRGWGNKFRGKDYSLLL